MDVLADSALEWLHPAHRRVLTLAGAGLDAPQIAALVGVEVTSVAPLLRIARLKLLEAIAAQGTAAVELLRGD